MTTNPNYKEFISTGIIQYITKEHLEQALNNIDQYTKKNNREEAKALLVTLYYTGCRPAEALLMKSKQVVKEKVYLKLLLRTLKGGRARTIWLSLYKFPLLRHLYNWHIKKYSEEYLFYHFQNKYTAKKSWKKKTGELVKKEYTEITDKLRYYFKIWFQDIIPYGINPYYLRHNKFSKLAEDSQVSDRDLMQIKGSRSYDSIAYYIHQSAKRGRKLASKGG